MGWLIGLSVSPVVGIAITCVTGIATTLIIALSGSGDKKPNWTINPWTIAVFVIGLAVLSPVGIWVRTHNLFGLDEAKLQDKIKASDLEEELQKWETVGISRTVTAERLFNYVFNVSTSKESQNAGYQNKTENDGVLFAEGVSTEECSKLLGEIDKPYALIDELKNSKKRYLQILASNFLSGTEITTNTDVLTSIIKDELCQQK